MIPTLVTIILLTVSPTVGIAPLTVKARVEINATFHHGEACLMWESTEEAGKDCWTVLPADHRVWEKRIPIREAGEWTIVLTATGRDSRDRPAIFRTTARVIAAQ